ncbi:MAG: GTPase ObgE [Clostridia bacterium]|nr:GTPase ObgE [Clostridia bacterium]MBQ9848931.1 GTPase ObgE [Clostridia bacterium]
MFIDKVTIYIKAGNGGNGCVSFRREKYVAKGGPDGGDGGKGGNVVFVTDEGENTLLNFKYRRKFVAANGGDGMPKKYHGKYGEDLIIPVPRGTVLRDPESGLVIHDMSDGLPYIAAKGGKGGWGNVHFSTPTRQVPRFAKSGTAGAERNITLELKMLADVGLVGFPNVGKSTLLSEVTAARPKIANYHFTTLSPNLGVVTVYGKSFVMADIPGLIEGASDGLGLGHDFLRHIDRCRLILHVFDISASEREDPLEDILKINSELEKYSPELASRPQILVGNKIDMGYSEEHVERIRKYAEENGCELFLIAGGLSEGVGELMKAVSAKLTELPPIAYYEEEYVEIPQEQDMSVSVEVVDGVYNVIGEWLIRLCNDINFDDYESLQFFQRVLRDKGVIQALEDAGIQEGDTVSIYGVEFDFMY